MPRSPTTHHRKVYIPSCQDDVEFQPSTSVVDTHWKIPENLTEYVTHVLWSLEEETFDEGASTSWTTVKEFVDVGFIDSIRESNLFLQDGGHYRSRLKLCNTVVCFESKTSNGFWVISQPPTSGTIQILSVESVGDATHLGVNFEEFAHSYLKGTGQPVVPIAYQWAIVEQIASSDTRFITPWQQVLEEDLSTLNGMVRTKSFELSIGSTFQFNTFNISPSALLSF